jgi:EKC/KEOPS complex subunit CGI121/TPRKB
VKLPLKPAAEEGVWEVDERVSRESVGKHLGDVVEGTSVEICEEGEELGAWCDVEKVRKVYKVSSANAGKKDVVRHGEDAQKEERKQMESVILGTIALKGS